MASFVPVAADATRDESAITSALEYSFLIGVCMVETGPHPIPLQRTTPIAKFAMRTDSSGFLE